MKNLKKYVYLNVISKLIVPIILVGAISFYFKRWEPIAAFLVICMFIIAGALRKLKRFENRTKIPETAILRDFVTAAKCGKWIVGQRYAYIILGFTLEVFQLEQITWAYGVNLTTYSQAGTEVHKKKKNQVAVWINDTREIRVDMKQETMSTFFMYLSHGNPDIKIGYEE